MVARLDEHDEAGRNEPATLTKTQARQGETPHVARYVLGWGLVLVIVAFALAYYFLV